MITRNYIHLEETVGEFTVSLNLPNGIAFDTALQLLANMTTVVQESAQKAAEQAALAEQQEVSPQATTLPAAEQAVPAA